MLLNFKLLRHPMNWVTIILMIVIAAFLFHLLEANFAPQTVAN